LRAVTASPDRSLDDVAKTLEDALYVTVGLGLQVVAKLQVRRRELQKTLGGTVGDNLKVVEERFRAATER
jgi:hypothetical protein